MFNCCMFWEKVRLVEAFFNITSFDFAAVINSSLDLLDSLLGRFFVPKLYED